MLNKCILDFNYVEEWDSWNLTPSLRCAKYEQVGERKL